MTMASWGPGWGKKQQLQLNDVAFMNVFLLGPAMIFNRRYKGMREKNPVLVGGGRVDLHKMFTRNLKQYRF